MLAIELDMVSGVRQRSGPIVGLIGGGPGRACGGDFGGPVERPLSGVIQITDGAFERAYELP